MRWLWHKQTAAEGKNIQKKLNQLLPDYFTLSFIGEGQNQKHLLSRTAKSFLGTKHQKLKIFLPNTSSNFRIKHTSPQSRLLHLLPNTSATLCNFVQELLASTTIRNKEFCLGLKSGVGQSKSQWHVKTSEVRADKIPKINRTNRTTQNWQDWGTKINYRALFKFCYPDLTSKTVLSEQSDFNMKNLRDFWSEPWEQWLIIFMSSTKGSRAVFCVQICIMSCYWLVLNRCLALQQ